jgi:glycosyltransferase involved in cell wall biosynthesis
MVRSLREQGIDARIVTTDDHGAEVLQVSAHGWSLHEGVPVWFFRRFSPPIPPIREFAYAAGFSKWIARQFADFDLLHVHAVFSYVSTTAMAAARRRGFPYVVRPLGQLDPYSLAQSAGRKRCYGRLIEDRNIRGAAAIQCTSRFEAELVQALFPAARAAVIPHGVSPGPAIPGARERLRTMYGIPEEKRILLFLSRLHPIKGIDELVMALAGFQEIPFVFILAGEGSPDFEQALRRSVARAGLENRTIFPGFLRGEQKQLHLQGSDLFLLPSFHENFGVAVLEALAVGCPVLVSREVGLADFVSGHQLGAVSERPAADAIAKALGGVFGDWKRWASTQERDRIRETALEAFQWSAVARQLGELYQGILRHTLPQT